MLTFEIVPFQGETLYLVDYVDLTLKAHTSDMTELEIVSRALGPALKGRRKTFETLSEAKTFIDTYIEHFALYMAECSEPKDKWIWSRE